MHLLQSLAFSGRLLSCILGLSIGLQTPVAIAAKANFLDRSVIDHATVDHLTIDHATKRTRTTGLEISHLAAPAPDPGLAHGWHRVEQHDAGFAVMMPEQLRYIQEVGGGHHTARESSDPSRARNANRQEQHLLSAADPHHATLYMVGWTTISPTVSADPESLALQWAAERNALLHSFRGELLHETNVQRPDHHHSHSRRNRRRRPRRHRQKEHSHSTQGKHYLILGSLDGEALLITHRSYVLGDRRYQITVALPQSHEPGARVMAEAFLQSFQFI